MIFKYFIARLKKTALPTALTSVALGLVVVLLMAAFSVPSILHTALGNQARRVSGDADIVLSLNQNYNNQFFSLTRLREDEVLMANSYYIYGHFSTVIQVQNERGDIALVTLYASEWYSQSKHNPLMGAIPGHGAVLDDFGIIIAAQLAEDLDVVAGQRIAFRVGGDFINFIIMGIADNTGIFYSGAAVFVENSALPRIARGLTRGMVTQVFIRANDRQSLYVIKQHLAYEFDHLVVSPAGVDAALTAVANEALIVSNFVAFITVLFSLISLYILLRLAFTKDRRNFELLNALGMQRGGLVAVLTLNGLVLCALGLTAAFLTVFFVSGLIGAIPILYCYVVPVWVYALSMSIGLVVGLMCAVVSGLALGNRAKRLKVQMPYHVKLAAFLAGVTFGIIGLFVIEAVPLLALIFICAMLFAVVFLLPPLIAPLYGFLHSCAKSMHTLIASATANKASSNRFSTFAVIAFVLAVFVISMPLTTGRAFTETPTLPFSAVIMSVAGFEDYSIVQVSSIEGVEMAARAHFSLSQNVRFREFNFNSTVLGLDAAGFELFGVDLDSALSKNGAFAFRSGAVIGRQTARNRALSIGDELTLQIRGVAQTIRVTYILNSSYLNGSFILLDIDFFYSGGAFSSIIVSGSEASLSAVAGIEGAGAVVSASDFGNFLTAAFANFAWLLNLLSGTILTLAIAALIFMIIIRRQADDKMLLRLLPVGLTKAKRIGVVITSVLMVMLPLVGLLPLYAFITQRASLGMFMLFGMRSVISDVGLLPVIVAAAGLAFVAAVEAIVSISSKSIENGG